MIIEITQDEKRIIDEILNLSHHHFDFMNNLDVISYDNFHRLLVIKPREKNFYLEADLDSIAKLRTVFEEYLSIAGSFDINGEITPTGKLIESLIDKFYVG